MPKLVTTRCGLTRLLLSPGETVRTFLGRTVTPVLRHLESSRRASLIRLVIVEGGRFPAIANVYRRLILEPLAAVITALATQAWKQGELQSDVLAREPLLLLSPGILSTLWNGLYGASEPTDAADLFEGFLDLVFKADYDGVIQRG